MLFRSPRQNTLLLGKVELLPGEDAELLAEGLSLGHVGLVLRGGLGLLLCARVGGSAGVSRRRVGEEQREVVGWRAKRACWAILDQRGVTGGGVVVKRNRVDVERRGGKEEEERGRRRTESLEDPDGGAVVVHTAGGAEGLLDDCNGRSRSVSCPSR